MNDKIEYLTKIMKDVDELAASPFDKNYVDFCNKFYSNKIITDKYIREQFKGYLEELHRQMPNTQLIKAKTRMPGIRKIWMLKKQ